MKTIQEQLELHEGVRRSAYQDSRGYWTIGVGRLIDKRLNGGLSDDEITHLFENDLAKIDDELNRVLPWWVGLDAVRRKVLQDMMFNMGAERLLKFKNTLAAVQRGDWNAAADGMLDSLWARQVGKEPNERAGRLAKMMQTGDDYGV